LGVIRVHVLFPSQCGSLMYDKKTSLGRRSNVTASLKAGIPIPILFSVCWHSHTGGHRGREAVSLTMPLSQRMFVRERRGCVSIGSLNRTRTHFLSLMQLTTGCVRNTRGAKRLVKSLSGSVVISNQLILELIP